MNERVARLMPNGTPRYIRVYDNGGASFDRYTVVFTGRYAGRDRQWTQYRGMSEHPYHTQGFGQWGEHDTYRYGPMDTNKAGFAPAIGRSNHLGKRITFAELPPDCRQLVDTDYRELWGIEKWRIKNAA